MFQIGIPVTLHLVVLSEYYIAELDVSIGMSSDDNGLTFRDVQDLKP